jgi:hypothetical protein
MINFSHPHIYRRKIIATGKFYIGKHNGNNKYYKGSGVDYLKDYNKYVINLKIDLFEEILEYVYDIKLLDEREEYWLNHFDVTNNPLYYNKTNRSRGWTFVTNKQKEKLRQSHLGKKQTKEASDKKRKKMLGKPKHTDLSKKIIGIKNSKPNPKVSEKLKNKPKTQEHKNKIKQTKQQFPTSKPSIPVLQYNLEGNFIKEWPSIKEAKLQHLGDIRSCCQDKQKTAGGYIWKYKN